MSASLVLPLVTACSSRSAAPAPTGESAAPTAPVTQALAAPRVATAASLATVDGAPPIIKG
jgi:hypothetical protein